MVTSRTWHKDLITGHSAAFSLNVGESTCVEEIRLWMIMRRGRSVTFKTFKTCILDEWPLKPLKSHLGPLLTCFFDVLTCIFLISIFSVLCVMFFEVVIADHQSRVLTRPFQRIGPTRLKSHPTHWQASQYAADTLPKHFEKFFTASKEFPTAC